MSHFILILFPRCVQSSLELSSSPGALSPHWAACLPTPSTACTLPSPAGTGAPCSWGVRRRSRPPQTLCRTGRLDSASAHGRWACCPKAPRTRPQSSASPKSSSATYSPPWQGQERKSALKTCGRSGSFVLLVIEKPLTCLTTRQDLTASLIPSQYW